MTSQPPTQRQGSLEESGAVAPEVCHPAEALLLGETITMPAADPADPGPTHPDTGERGGCCIGPYRLLQQIGEGGMGAVYLAEQQQPVRRKVALKLIKP